MGGVVDIRIVLPATSHGSVFVFRVHVRRKGSGPVGIRFKNHVQTDAQQPSESPQACEKLLCSLRIDRERTESPGWTARNAGTTESFECVFAESILLSARMMQRCSVKQ